MIEFKVNYDEYFSKSFTSFYDEIDIVDFKYHPETQQFSYPCPCGDIFLITLDDLKNGETIAKCVSCSLIVMIIYEERDLQKYTTI